MPALLYMINKDRIQISRLTTRVPQLNKRSTVIYAVFILMLIPYILYLFRPYKEYDHTMISPVFFYSIWGTLHQFLL